MDERARSFKDDTKCAEFATLSETKTIETLILEINANITVEYFCAKHQSICPYGIYRLGRYILLLTNYCIIVSFNVKSHAAFVLTIINFRAQNIVLSFAMSGIIRLFS